jgi:hypothetical protein
MKRNLIRLCLLVGGLLIWSVCKDPTGSQSDRLDISIESLTIDPAEGIGKFTVTVRVGAHRDDLELVGFYLSANATISRDIASELLPGTDKARVLTYTFEEGHAGEYTAYFTLSGTNQDRDNAYDKKSVSFTVLNGKPATLKFHLNRATINESVSIYQNSENFPRVSDTNCWTDSSTVFLTIELVDGTLNGHCMWESKDNFTIESTLTGTYSVSASIDFWLQQVVTYVNGGGTTIKLWHGTADRVAAHSADGMATFSYSCSTPNVEGRMACAYLKEGTGEETHVHSLRLTGTIPWSMTW